MYSEFDTSECGIVCSVRATSVVLQFVCVGFSSWDLQPTSTSNNYHLRHFFLIRAFHLIKNTDYTRIASAHNIRLLAEYANCASIMVGSSAGSKICLGYGRYNLSLARKLQTCAFIFNHRGKLFKISALLQTVGLYCGCLCHFLGISVCGEGRIRLMEIKDYYHIDNVIYGLTQFV